MGISLESLHIADGTHRISQAMRKKYKREMDYVYAIMNDLERKLERPIRDLDDVRTVMETLKKIREQEVDMELKIDPVEVRDFTNRIILSHVHYRLVSFVPPR